MKKEVTIEKKTFTDPNGVVKEYNAITLDVGGRQFYLFPRENDKKLLGYILGQERKQEDF